MPNPLSRLGETFKDAVDKARDQLPDVTLISDVDVPIYIVHNGPDAEDYDLICDFERFMKEGQSGLLKRPALRLWAGRADFERHIFARHLRTAFSTQFDIVRAAHKAEVDAKRSNWLQVPSLGELIFWGLSGAGGLAGSVLLYLATTVGGEALKDVVSRLGKTLGVSENPENAIEDLIESKKDVIDQALTRVDITRHRDLYVHAWRGQRPGPMTGMDRNAWPLPDFVRERMG